MSGDGEGRLAASKSAGRIDFDRVPSATSGSTGGFCADGAARASASLDTPSASALRGSPSEPSGVDGGAGTVYGGAGTGSGAARCAAAARRNLIQAARRRRVGDCSLGLQAPGDRRAMRGTARRRPARIGARCVAVGRISFCCAAGSSSPTCCNLSSTPAMSASVAARRRLVTVRDGAAVAVVGGTSCDGCLASAIDQAHGSRGREPARAQTVSKRRQND